MQFASTINAIKPHGARYCYRFKRAGSVKRKLAQHNNSRVGSNTHYSGNTRRMIVVSHPEYFDGEIEAINALFEAGLSSFHVRKNKFNGGYLDAVTLNPENSVILHGDPVHARKHGTGVHFKAGQPITKFKGLFTSVAAHSIDELMEFDGLVDRIMLSPVFDSISKNNYRSNFDIKELKYLFNHTKFHSEIVALGGLNERTAIIALEAGFNDVATLGFVWNSFFNGGIDAMLLNFEKLKCR